MKFTSITKKVALVLQSVHSRLHVSGIILLLVSMTGASVLSGNTDSVLLWPGNNENETQSIMLTLEASIRRIEEASVRPLTNAERRRAIDRELQIIEELAELLASDVRDQAASAQSNHSHQVVDERIDSFLHNVKQARDEVARNPANYYLAGKLVGYCQACHQYRDRLVD